MSIVANSVGRSVSTYQSAKRARIQLAVPAKTPKAIMIAIAMLYATVFSSLLYPQIVCQSLSTVATAVACTVIMSARLRFFVTAGGNRPIDSACCSA